MALLKIGLLIIVLGMKSLGLNSEVGHPIKSVFQDAIETKFSVSNDNLVVEDETLNHKSIVVVNHHSEEKHGADTSILLFVIIAIFIGSLTRHFLKKVSIPFTALLLIIGLVLGVITRMGGFENWGGIDVHFIGDSLNSAAHIDPHLLLYLFLPILIFEAAFGIDLHTFKRSVSNAVILAVPGITLALGLSAVMVFALDYYNLGLSGWGNWSLALMFGAVISATDPVAVVALLKELGASKKLGTLIEGESLLNDGTAIVIFMVFFGALTGTDSEVNGFLQFAIVSFGGIAVGVTIGWVIIKWLMNIFNDAMVEISIVIGAAYLTFYFAEHFFHVSGVLALVSLGIMIGGVGRASISPKVEHFMSEFWELAGFISNCIIFLIVGIIISTRTEFTFNDFVMLGVVYIGVHIIRAIVLFVFYPLMKNTGYGLAKKDAIIVWYGALRGAIGLAMALMVMGIDSEIMAQTMNVTVEEVIVIKNQFLFLTAGVVTLSLLINATTIKSLINYLGLLDVSPAKELSIHDANEYLRKAELNKIAKIKDDRYLKKADWNYVKQYITKEIKLNDKLKDIQTNTLAETRLRILEHEKSSYLKQYSKGVISYKSLPYLIEIPNALLDRGGEISLADRTDLDKWWGIPKWLKILMSLKVLKPFTTKLLYNRLSISQDVAISFIKAQEDCLSLLKILARNENLPIEDLNQIEEELNMNKIQGQVYIRNLRQEYADLYAAISTQQATRGILNYEDKTIERLLKNGEIDEKEANKMRARLQEKWKRLQTNPPAIKKKIK